MIAVLIIPTGIGAEFGGHAGDANPIAQLIGSVCDKLITHPNVVNASDINEMPPNTLYVEGAMLDGFLSNEFNLQLVRKNKILVAMNPPLKSELINSVSAARITLGLEAEVVLLKTPIKMIGGFNENGQATGDISGVVEMLDQIKNLEFDALAIASPIEVNKESAWKYLKEGGVNLWGGVEAKLSKMVYKALNKPVAHAPIDSGLFKDFDEIVDVRMAAECVSVSYIHCVLKGLQRAPRASSMQNRNTISVEDVDCLITPPGIFGPPHYACRKYGIPIIVVEENENQLKIQAAVPENTIFVKSYLEVIGAIQAMKCGLSLESLRRPVKPTAIHMDFPTDFTIGE